MEAKPDGSAREIGGLAADALKQRGYVVEDVIDPFMGSGNLAFHVAREIGAKHIGAFEKNKLVADTTKQAFDIVKMAAAVDLRNTDWTDALGLLRAVSTLVILDPLGVLPRRQMGWICVKQSRLSPN